MPCYRPMHGYRNADGQFSYQIPDYYYPGDELSIPCGKCIGCLRSTTSDWALRSEHELRYHEQSCFATFTYSDDCLPPDGNLVHRHWQLFTKRLRESHGPFRYLMSGEQGPKTFRPHYHSILFGQDFKADSYPIQHGLYRSPVLDALWGHGYVHVGDATGASASYVAGYVTGKLQERLANPGRGTLRGQRSEAYISMSNRPGIGKPFYDEFKHELFAASGAIRLGKTHFVRIPQYYKTLYQRDHPDLFDAFQARARLRAESHFKAQSDLDRIESVKLIHLSRTPRDNHP